MFEDSRTVAIKVRIERYSVANIPEQARPLLRHSREDNGEAEDEPGQRDEFGHVVTIRPHVSLRSFSQQM